MNSKILILCSEFNKNITDALLDGARQELAKVPAKADVEEVWVPGAFELPTAASAAIESENYDAIICLGAVIKGDSAHFEHVAGCCADRLSELGADAGIPVIFGVLTTYDLHQALERSGQTTGGHNHGIDYAQAAIKMIDVIERLSS